MNEKLVTTAKVDSRTVNYTCWEREISFLQWSDTGLINTPRQVPWSGVVDQYILGSMLSMCVLLLGYSLAFGGSLFFLSFAVIFCLIFEKKN